MPRTRAAPALAVSFLLALSGCATLPKSVAVPTDWPQRLSMLQAIDQFQLQGRLAAVNGNDGFSAGLRWQQKNDRASIDLSAPLGVGAAHVEQNGSALHLTTSQGVTLDDAAAAAQLSATLGFEPPLHSLRYWVLGASDPMSPAQPMLDEQQRLKSLDQDGWHIDYADYQQVGQVWLPQRVTVSRPPLKLKLVINTWRL